MSILADPRVADALARLPDYLGGHVLVSVTALGARAAGQPAARARFAPRRPQLRGIAAGADQRRADHSRTCAARLVLSAAARRSRRCPNDFSASDFPRSASCRRCWRSRSIPCCRCCETPSRASNGIDPARQRGRAGRRHDAAAIACSWWNCRSRCRYHGGHPYGVGLGDRHRDAVDADRADVSLGNYIFTGLQTQNWVFVLFGCVAAALLALVVDQLLALMESGVRPRSRARWHRRHAGHRTCRCSRRSCPACPSRSADYRDRRQAVHRAVHPGSA